VRVPRLILTVLGSILLVALAAFFMFPILLAAMNSLKTEGQMYKSVLALPIQLQWVNYAHVLKDINLLHNLYNTFVITILSVIGIILCSSLAGYKLSRTPGRLSKVIFFLFLSSMLVPFYTIMFPLIQVARGLHVQGSIYGIPLIYVGLGVNFAIFLYHGFVKAIPRAMEESAQMDGCNQLETFVRVVFPLLIPVTMTIAILDSLWIWNDFLLPLVIINKYNNYTLVLAASIFFGQYTTEWSSILSILMLTSIPVILLYLLFQSYIVRGIAEGAIKG
jgi:raffinose/stachyose/melibiose transport system permease protein